MMESQEDRCDFRINSTLEDDDNDLKAIYGQQWRVHWVTPLRDLVYTEARLKKYALHLRWALQSAESLTHVNVKVTALPELRPDEDAPVPLQILVEAVDGENKKQCVYSGIMLSWTKPRRPELDFVHLPLLLCRGGIKATELVHRTLHVLFDCNIKDMTFEAGHMLWMIGLAAHFHGEELDDLHLRFNCPGLGDENLLDYTVQMGVLKEMWRSIHGPETAYITYDEIISLRDKCYSSLEEIYGIRVIMLQLIRIRWRGFLFSVNGHIKFPRVLTKLLLKLLEDIGYTEENRITGWLNQNKRARQE